MNKLVAVQGCTITYSTDPNNIGLSLSTSVSVASSKVKSGNKKAYKDKITISIVSGFITLSSPPAGASTNIGVVPEGTITIDGTSEEATTEGGVFVLQGDEGTATFVCTFTQTSGPNPIPVNVDITAKVSDAGQSVLKVT